MTPNLLKIETKNGAHPGLRTIRLTGRLSLETVAEFNQFTRAQSAPVIILDMSPLVYLDSAGVGALVQLQVRCAKGNQQLALAGLTPRVHAVLQVANVLSLFRIFPSASEAEAAIAPASS